MGLNEMGSAGILHQVTLSTRHDYVVVSTAERTTQQLKFKNGSSI